jgi:hypothetical protein
MREMAICTKPLARRTLPRAHGTAIFLRYKICGLTDNRPHVLYSLLNDPSFGTAEAIKWRNGH